ncbi:class I SAM-dependent methyltransferase [Aliiglaciecola litoralis]|uniref:Methyltransferase domain-containing protein n=1 Tax=Aliiglaciecola litoralis TaxID=582857 RepID=A0ABN1LMX2_9ALTE
MKPALTSKKPLYPASWDELPVGQGVRQLLQDCVLESSRRFFGYHLVKVGCLSGEITLPTCTIKHIINVVNSKCISEAPSSTDSLLVADAHKLPFLENSVDAYLLAHELDFSRDPHQILREVDRTLIANGHVIIVGFNPFSPAGLFRLLPLKSNKLMRDARFFTSVRIKDWLHLLGFEIIEQKQLLFSSVLLNRKHKIFSKLERLFCRYLPIFSSVYVIVAKKRVIPLSLIKPKWKASPKFSPVSASMRSSMRNNSQ